MRAGASRRDNPGTCAERRLALQEEEPLYSDRDYNVSNSFGSIGNESVRRQGEQRVGFTIYQDIGRPPASSAANDSDEARGEFALRLSLGLRVRVLSVQQEPDFMNGVKGAAPPVFDSFETWALKQIAAEDGRFRSEYRPHDAFETWALNQISAASDIALMDIGAALSGLWADASRHAGLEAPVIQSDFDLPG